DAYKLLDQHWQRHFPHSPAVQTYIDSFSALLDGFAHVPKELALLALASCHTALGSAWPLEAVLLECYAAKVDEAKIAEALSLALWPCGVNKFLDASGVWLRLMQSGRVSPSPAFAAWASAPGQDGMDIG